MSKPAPTKVGIVGLGTVGGEVFRRLMERGDVLERRIGAPVEVRAVADLVRPDHLEDLISSVNHYESAETMMDEEEIDVLVELIGGLSPAKSIITEALSRGIDVVTANKELLAKDGEAIFQSAEENDARIRFEASVGGSIPVVRTLKEAFVDVDVRGAYGIINGTANYVLTRMENEGQSFDEALEMAQEKGYAEADPSYDVEGDDTAHKLAMLAALGFGSLVSLDEVYCEGITDVTPEIVSDAEDLGYRIKLLGIVKKVDGELDVRVHPTMVPRDSALAAVREEYNAVFVKADPLGSSMLYGKGAGGAPTATAVVGDVAALAVRNDRARAPIDFNPGHTVRSIERIKTRYYLRLMAEDEPGVLAGVTEILGNHDISIDSVIQHGRSREAQVPVVLTTHRAREGNVQQAVEEIADLEAVGSDPVLLRIEEDLEED
jgi:homoserine dehydrogenase